MRLKEWQKYINRLTDNERSRLLYLAIGRLLETKEIEFQYDDINTREGLYWPGGCDDLLGDNQEETTQPRR